MEEVEINHRTCRSSRLSQISAHLTLTSNNASKQSTMGVQRARQEVVHQSLAGSECSFQGMGGGTSHVVG